MTPPNLDRRDVLRLGLAGAGLVGGGLAMLPLHRSFAQTPAPKSLALADVNRMDKTTFVAAFGDVVEFSPWAAEAACACHSKGPKPARSRWVCGSSRRRSL